MDASSPRPGRARRVTRPAAVVSLVLGAPLVFALASALAACAGKSTGNFALQDGTDASTSGPGSSGQSSDPGQSSTFSSDDGGASQTGTCQSGTYGGAFSCNFIYDPSATGVTDASPEASMATIVGTLGFLLTQDVTSSGELSHTDTASGHFDLQSGPFTGAANIGGTLDCATGHFTGAITDGGYGLGPIPGGMFAGPVASRYDGVRFAFVDGTWSMTIPGLGYCPGTWSARYLADAAADQ